MAASPSFSLSRASPEDMDEIVLVEYAAFDTDFIRETFMGCKSASELPRLAQHYRDNMLKSQSGIWIKVVDDATTKIVAGSYWNVYPAYSSEDDATDLLPWLEGETKEESLKMHREMGTKRRAAVPAGYVHLHICFTSPSYRRRGAGAMMMKWGTDVADALCLPSWIEASEEGTRLYETFDFYEHEKIETGPLAGGVNMKRDPLVTLFKGGKPDLAN